MIKVFYSSISGLSPSDFDVLYNSLPQWRKETTDKITQSDEKLRSCAAGALFVRALASVGTDPHAAVVFNANGKPYLKDFPHTFFSISHSGELVLCAVSDQETGCDIQQISAARFPVAKRFFTESEQRQVSQAALPENEFARIWTRKESYVKMLGTGISACPLPTFDVSDQCPSVDAVFYEQSHPGYHAAVCQRYPADQISWIEISLI